VALLSFKGSDSENKENLNVALWEGWGKDNRIYRRWGV